MPAQNEINETTRIRKLLKDIKVGHRVRATNRTNAKGIGTVIDAYPFSSDGVRRIAVLWDSGTLINVLPESIEILR